MNEYSKYASIKTVCKKYGIKGLEEAKQICDNAKLNIYDIVKGIQPICFDNAVNAYELGAAIAIKSGAKSAQEVAIKIAFPESLAAFHPVFDRQEF